MLRTDGDKLRRIRGFHDNPPCFRRAHAAANEEDELEPIGLSIPDTGKALGGDLKPLSRTTIWRMVSRGDLEARKVGGRTLITVDSIKAVMAAAPRPGGLEAEAA